MGIGPLVLAELGDGRLEMGILRCRRRKKELRRSSSEPPARLMRRRVFSPHIRLTAEPTTQQT